MVRRTSQSGLDLFSVTDYKKLIGQSSEEEIDAIRSRYCNYKRWHRQAFTELMRGAISDDDFYDKLQSDRRKAKSPKSPRGPGGLTTAGERKLVKLAARVLYYRACKTKSRILARRHVIAELSDWAAQSTIYGYLRPDKCASGEG